MDQHSETEPMNASDELTAGGVSAGAADLDRVHEREHIVAVGGGRRVHVVEKFTLRSTSRSPGRAILLLPGPIVTSSFYDLASEGYALQSELARAGFFAFALDYEGSGRSSFPPDGRAVTHEFLVDESRAVLEAVRWLRRVPRVDVMGASIGGAIASELCADATRTRTCVMSSMTYRTGTPFFRQVFLDPAFVAFLESQPDGYLDVAREQYFVNIISRSPAPVAERILATQPGRYAVGPLVLPAKGLPWFDPTGAAVPGLLLHGTEDSTAEQSDGDDLRASYGRRGGGVAELVRIEGGGHIPHIESAPFHERWKSAVLAFLNSH